MFGFETPVFPVLTTLVSMACPTPSIPPVHVSQSVARPDYEFSLSSHELAEFDIDTIPPYAPDEELRVGGLTAVEIVVVADVKFKSMTDTRHGEICVWPSEINVRLKQQPKIYIASEHPVGTCRHRAVMHHEMKHVATDERLGKKLLPRLRQAVESAIAQKPVSGPGQINEVAALKKEIIAHIDQSVETVLQDFYIERSKAQQAIDNIDEYRRTQARCDGGWYTETP